ncbi:hypothetical protein NDU88_002071 [Pleurodeles waltl]|uniref:Uncharacterized protein n=1 Tax=Pleurodeles waltl TaxID=8319 RepID=A0AAV7KUB8_PLEWA|nr:hypothetical protein NDU88_002071 [Pleurodeles waltl]
MLVTSMIPASGFGSAIPWSLSRVGAKTRGRRCEEQKTRCVRSLLRSSHAIQQGGNLMGGRWDVGIFRDQNQITLTLRLAVAPLWFHD